MELTQAYLKSIVHYDPETGVFTRKAKTSNRIKAGDIMGCVDSNGYLTASIMYRLYRLHRLAFLYMEGCLPPAHVDHINGIRHDNRWANLRHATDSVNRKNSCRSTANTSGVVGVSWDSRRSKWEAYIKADKRHHHLGRYSELADAVSVRKAAEIKYGFHDNHGRDAHSSEAAERRPYPTAEEAFSKTKAGAK